MSFLVFAVAIFASCSSFEYYSAEIYAEDGNWDMAIHFLKKSIIKEPNDARAYILLAQVYAAQDKYDLMNLALDKAKSLIADTSGDLNWKNIRNIREYFWTLNFDAGVFYFENNQFPEAGYSFYQCTNIDSARPEAYVNLGLVEEKLNLPDSAIFHYEKAFARDTSNIDLIFYAANLCLELEKYDKSLELLNQILKIRPKMTRAIVQKAISFDLKGEIDSAIACYEKAIALDSTNQDLYYNLGRMHFIQENYLQAIQYFDRVLEKQPDDGETISLIGECYFSLGEDMAINQHVFDTDSAGELSQEAYDFLTKSITYFEKAIQNGFDSPDIRNMLAIAKEHRALRKKSRDSSDSKLQ